MQVSDWMQVSENFFIRWTVGLCWQRVRYFLYFSGEKQMALTFVLSSRVLEILPSHSCSRWLWLRTLAGCSNCPRWAVCSGAVCCCCARYKGKGRWLLGRSLVQARKLGGFTENALSGLLRILDQKCWLLALHGGKTDKIVSIVRIRFALDFCYCTSHLAAGDCGTKTRAKVLGGDSRLWSRQQLLGSCHCGVCISLNAVPAAGTPVIAVTFARLCSQQWQYFRRFCTAWW